MSYQDAFVGLVSIGLGTTGVVAAIGNWDRCYELRKARWIEALAGRSTARMTYGLVGLGLIALGVAIACGFAPNQSQAMAYRFKASNAVPRP